MKFKSVLAICMIGAAAVANAQAEKPIGFDARVGAFLPLNSDAQSVGNSWLAFGLDFDLKQMQAQPGSSSSLALSVDYSYRHDARQVPVLLNYVHHHGPVYYLAGAGVNFSSLPSADTSNKARFGYDVGIGYDFLRNGSTPVFVEGRFFGSEVSQFDGFGVFVGIRL